MSQPPYAGQLVPPSTDFGAPTVTGNPAGAPSAPSRGTGNGTNGVSTAAPTHHAAGATTSAPVAPPPPAPSAPAHSAAPPTPPTSAGGGAAPAGRLRRSVRGPRRARLQLRHVNPWTVLKFSCVLSIALFFVWLIVIGLLFGILDATGVINKINDAVTTINGPGSTKPVTPGVVFGGAALIGVINVLLFIALTTVGSVIYNLCADLVGGIELTLSEA
jgi:hypothetical protein